MPSKFLNRFKRITYSTSYLPEIDGLRFLAIFSVVVIMHITHYLDEKFYNDQLLPEGYWRNFVMEGGNGVALFFIISGFILSLPFARWRFNGQRKVRLKNYFLRRVTRLEPPYLIALLIFFVAQVWVLGNYSFRELFPNLMASAVYVHTLVYHAFSPILPVAWSLEVEVQFYLLAPLFCLVFLIRPDWLRRGFLTAVILAGSVYWFNDWAHVHVFKFLHYFFCGILLADLYCHKIVLVPGRKTGLVMGLFALAGFLFLPSINTLPGFLGKILCMFFLVHTVLTNPFMKKIFSINAFVLIGGMCYTIYLLHLAVVSFVGHQLLKPGFQPAGTIWFFILGLLLILAVLIVSSVYFLFIERPFMKPIGLKRPA